MIEPTGYTALDLIGFTDRGAYDPTANYVKNDIVTVGNTKWRCKVDDTTGVTPDENANWTIYLESATSIAGMDDVTITSPANDDGIVYNSTTQEWGNVPIMTKEQWKKNGAYNLLPKELYASTQVSHGITWTINADGSVGTSNTSKDNTNESFVLLSRTSGYTVPAGQYCFCGKPSSSKYRMMLQCTRGGVLTVLADLDNNTTKAIVTIQEGDALQVALTVKANETGGDTFYPMLTTDLSATNADFTTPAKTNRELTEDTSIKFYDLSSAKGTNVTFLSASAVKLGDMVFLQGHWIGSNNSSDIILTVPQELNPKATKVYGYGVAKFSTGYVAGEYSLKNTAGNLYQSISSSAGTEGEFSVIYSISKSTT